MRIQRKQECNDRSGPTCLRPSRALRPLRGGVRRWQGQGPPLDAALTLRTTGLLTARRNPGDRTCPDCLTVAIPTPRPTRAVRYSATSTGAAAIAGPGHELTPLPRVGPLGGIRPAGRDGTGDGLGETSGPGSGLRGPRSGRESCPGGMGCAMD